MKKFRTPANRYQQTLLPRSIDEFAPKDDAVRYVDNLVDELDLKAIKSKYSSKGRPAYSPAVMVKLLVYGKIRGLRSSRELAQACRENLKFIFITSGEQPDFRTISLFRKTFSKELAEILRQTIVIGLETGAITLEHVAVDGTLIRSFAGENSYKTREKILEELAFLEDSIQKDIDEEQSSDDDDDEPTGSTLPKGLRDPEQRKEKLRAALAKHKSFDYKPKREQPKKISTTDPDSRYMRKGPAYNGQAAVDEGSRMVVAGYTTSAGSDAGQLRPVIREIEFNTKQNPQKLTADAGYSDRMGLKDMADRNIEGYVPQRKATSSGYPVEQFSYNEQDDSYTCPEGKQLRFSGKDMGSFTYSASLNDCRECQKRTECVRFADSVSPRSIRVSRYQDLVTAMEQRTGSAEGVIMAKKRSSTVETVFGHIKYARKLRQFLFRGMNMVNNMWQFELAVYNLERIITLRRNGMMKLA